MKIGIPILLAALSILILSVSASAQLLSCTMSQTPCTAGVDVFHTSDSSNAHAELPSQSNYNNYVCCTGIQGLGNSCSGSQGTDYDIIFRLSDQTNAHVERKILQTPAYNGNEACLSVSDGNRVVCVFFQGTCPYGSACLASVSGDTNAHLTDCDDSSAYTTKVCCAAGEMPERAEFTGIPAGWQRASANVVLRCREGDGDCDENTLKTKIYTSDPGDCPETYSEYDLPPSQTVTSHVWLCGVGQDYRTRDYFFSTPKEILVDQESPTVTDDYQSKGQWSSITQRITLFPTDTGDSQLDNVSYCFGDGCEPDTETEGNYYTDITSSYEGTFRYRAWDMAGNPSAYGTFSLMVDVVDPVTTDNTDSDPNKWYSSSFYVELTCTDDMSGCEETLYCEYEQGSAPCTPSQSGAGFTVTCSERCNKIIRYHSTDSAGRTEQTRDSNVIRMDASRPSCTMTEISEYTSSPDIQLSWQGDSEIIETYEIRYKMDGGTYNTWDTFDHPTTSATFTGQENHKYTFECIPTNQFDLVGGPANEVSTFIDTVPPDSWLIVPAWSNSSVFEVVWDGDDFGGSGISSFSVDWKKGTVPWLNWLTTDLTSDMFGQGGNPANAQNGDTIDLRVMATDGVGNAGEYSQTSQIGIDLDIPTCQMEDLEDYITSSDFEISWSGSDSASGIAEYDVQVNDGIDWQYTIQETDLTEKTFSGIDGGEYSFRCRARDNAGNRGDWSALEETTVDLSAPIVDAQFPEKVVQNRTMTIETTINDHVAIESATLFYDNQLHEYSQLVETSAGTWAVTWDIDTSQVQENEYGTHSFSITTSDTNGNNRTTSYDFDIVLCNTGEEKVCGTDTGVCIAGLVECNILGLWGDCQGSIEPSDEECNGLDDDCNGETDDGIDCSCSAGETRICGTDTGECQSGTQTCSDQGRWEECLNGIGPRPEECNGLDDDCNGLPDDAPSPGCCDPLTYGRQPVPGTTDIGVCVMGFKTCVNGVPDITTEPVYPEDELCGNSLDDDCDGKTDEICETCENGLKDIGEEGIDCGGDCPRECGAFSPDVILILLGVIVLVVISVLYLYFRSKGEELTWESLRKRWTPGE
jgi:hypothetical protein